MVLFLRLLFACGGNQVSSDLPSAVAVSSTPAVSGLDDPLRFAPADTIGMIALDMDRFRTSPYFQIVRDRFLSREELDAQDKYMAQTFLIA